MEAQKRDLSSSTLRSISYLIRDCAIVWPVSRSHARLRLLEKHSCSIRTLTESVLLSIGKRALINRLLSARLYADAVEQKRQQKECVF